MVTFVGSEMGRPSKTLNELHKSREIFQFPPTAFRLNFEEGGPLST